MDKKNEKGQRDSVKDKQGNEEKKKTRRKINREGET